MSPTRDELMTVGQFSALTLLTSKALRVYADRGLLSPRQVDPHSGYRYYAADQVQTGWLIGLLRSADLPLDQIADIISPATSDRQTAVARLDDAIAAIDRRTAAQHAVLARARLHLRQETSMSAVHTALETDRAVLSVLRKMTPPEMDEVIHSELARLREAATAAKVRVVGDPFGIFHAPITDDSDGPLEIVLPIDAVVDSTGDIRSYRLAGGHVATRTARGHETYFPEILALYDEVHAWITNAGRTPSGPPREIWHNSPRDAEDLQLTIAWPFTNA